MQYVVLCVCLPVGRVCMSVCVCVQLVTLASATSTRNVLSAKLHLKRRHCIGVVVLSSLEVKVKVRVQDTAGKLMPVSVTCVLRRRQVMSVLTLL